MSLIKLHITILHSVNKHNISQQSICLPTYCYLVINTKQCLNCTLNINHKTTNTDRFRYFTFNGSVIVSSKINHNLSYYPGVFYVDWTICGGVVMFWGSLTGYDPRAHI